MKKCTICNELKELEEFVKSKSSKDGRRNQCKACINAELKEKHKANKIKNTALHDSNKQLVKELAMSASHKVCYTCNEEKLKIEHFTKDASKVDGFHPSCKKCKNSLAAQRRLDNLESKRTRDRAYAANNKEAKAKADLKYREANKEKLKTAKKEYYQKNTEKLKNSNRLNRLNRTPEQIESDKIRSRENYLNETPEQKQRRIEYGKLYHKTLSGKLSSARNAHKRRALKLSQEDGTVTSQALENLKNIQKHKCYYCGEALEYDKNKAVHLDHYIPLSEGGLHSITNVVWSCGPCNWSKGNTIPVEPLMLPNE